MKNYKQGAKHSRMYDNKFIKGVHKPKYAYPLNIESYAESSMGYQIRGMQGPGPCGSEYHWFTAIRDHVDVINEAKLIKPKLKGI